MQTFNEEYLPAPPHHAFRLACQVERWPQLLPHYRWVRFHEGGAEAGGLVEMAARRPFGRLAWPVWWLSRMWVEPESLAIRYQHIAGVTRGMAVRWQIEPAPGRPGSRVTILHEWPDGPRFAGPLAPAVGSRVIGPLFVHFIAGRTLHHLAQHAAREMALCTSGGR